MSSSTDFVTEGSPLDFMNTSIEEKKIIRTSNTVEAPEPTFDQIKDLLSDKPIRFNCIRLSV